MVEKGHEACHDGMRTQNLPWQRHRAKYTWGMWDEKTWPTLKEIHHSGGIRWNMPKTCELGKSNSCKKKKKTPSRWRCRAKCARGEWVGKTWSMPREIYHGKGIGRNEPKAWVEKTWPTSREIRHSGGAEWNVLEACNLEKPDLHQEKSATT